MNERRPPARRQPPVRLAPHAARRARRWVASAPRGLQVREEWGRVSCCGTDSDVSCVAVIIGVLLGDQLNTLNGREAAARRR